MSLARIQSLGGTEVLKVVVVCDDLKELRMSYLCTDPGDRYINLNDKVELWIRVIEDGGPVES